MHNPIRISCTVLSSLILLACEGVALAPPELPIVLTEARLEVSGEKPNVDDHVHKLEDCCNRRPVDKLDSILREGADRAWETHLDLDDVIKQPLPVSLTNRAKFNAFHEEAILETTSPAVAATAGLRFRSAHDLGSRSGKIGAFPNYHEVETANGSKFGTKFLNAGSRVEIPQSALGVSDSPTPGELFRAMDEYARRQGKVGILPNFHEADHGDGRVFGAVEFTKQQANWRAVPRVLLRAEADTFDGRFRALNDFADNLGFSAAFPTFHSLIINGRVYYGAVFLRGGVADTRDASRMELARRVTTGFDVNRHGFRFVNSFKSDIQFKVPKFGTIELGKGRFGLCGGMIYLALDAFRYELSNGVPVESPRTRNDTPPKNETRLHAALWRRQKDSLTANNYSTTRRIAEAALENIGTVRKKSRSAFKKTIRRRLDAGIPVPLVLVATNRDDLLGILNITRPSRIAKAFTKNHQVLAIGYEEIPETGARTEHRLVVYDPNYPGRESFVSLSDLDLVDPNGGSHDYRGFVISSYDPETPYCVKNLTCVECIDPSPPPVQMLGDTLTAGSQLLRNQGLVSDANDIRLVMQLDGNLVLYRGNKALWATNTNSQPVERCLLQGDGELVLLSSKGKVLWRSKSAGRGGDRLLVQNDGNLVIYAPGKAVWATGTEAVNKPDSKDLMLSQEELKRGQELVSSNGRTRLIFQDDGNLVVYRDGKATWASDTNGKPAARCVLQGDGNLVIYSSAGKALWASGTDGKGSSRLVVQDDGNVVLYASKGPTWATDTNE